MFVFSEKFEYFKTVVVTIIITRKSTDGTVSVDSHRTVTPPVTQRK